MVSSDPFEPRQIVDLSGPVTVNKASVSGRGIGLALLVRARQFSEVQQDRQAGIAARQDRKPIRVTLDDAVMEDRFQPELTQPDEDTAVMTPVRPNLWPPVRSCTRV